MRESTSRLQGRRGGGESGPGARGSEAAVTGSKPVVCSWGSKRQAACVRNRTGLCAALRCFVQQRRAWHLNADATRLASIRLCPHGELPQRWSRPKLAGAAAHPKPALPMTLSMKAEDILQRLRGSPERALPSSIGAALPTTSVSLRLLLPRLRAWCNWFRGGGVRVGAAAITQGLTGGWQN